MLSELCVANSLLNKEGYMQGIDKELYVSLSRLLKNLFSQTVSSQDKECKP